MFDEPHLPAQSLTVLHVNAQEREREQAKDAKTLVPVMGAAAFVATEQAVRLGYTKGFMTPPAILLDVFAVTAALICYKYAKRLRLAKFNLDHVVGWEFPSASAAAAPTERPSRVAPRA